MTDPEVKLLCGDPKIEGWRTIPLNQAEYFMRAFLQQRGYHAPRFVDAGMLPVCYDMIMDIFRPLAAAAFLGLAAVPARAGLFGRSKLASHWTVKTLAVDGDDAEWDEEFAFEEDGLSVLAKNDGQSLYLLVTAHTSDARDQLSGVSRQDLAFWFVAADGKTRRWGARIPFSRRASVTTALHDPAGLDPEPEFVRYEGTAVSTDSLPGDVRDRLAAVGRRPIWELKIPLKRLEVDPEGAVAVDFVLSAPPAGTKRRAASGASRSDAPADGGEQDSGRGRGRDKRGEAGGSHPEELVWNAQSYALSVRLAADPAQPR